MFEFTGRLMKDEINMYWRVVEIWVVWGCWFVICEF